MSYDKEFEEIKYSSDSEEINEFLIKIAHEPREKYLSYINYFIDNISKELLNKIRVNLVYLIGEIASVAAIPSDFLDFLKNQYYSSDRWERNEIIKAFKNIIKHQHIGKDYVDLIASAVKEDYLILKENAFEVLLELNNIREENIQDIILSIDSNEREIIKLARKVLQKVIKNKEKLFTILDNNDIYKYIDKIAIRTLLLTFFKTVMSVERFREQILNSEWEKHAKTLFLDEIDTYEKILLQNP